MKNIKEGTVDNTYDNDIAQLSGCFQLKLSLVISA
jgi:hypothetical protein